MPIIKSAKKQQRADVKKRDKNLKIKGAVKKAVKNFERTMEFKNFQDAQSEIDKAVKKGLIKKNTAARRKAALVKTAKKAGVKVVAKVKKSGDIKIVTNKAKTAAPKKAAPKKTGVNTDKEVVKAKKPVAKKNTKKVVKKTA